MSSRPRSTSATTVDAPASSSTVLLHDSRPRSHSYADPRAAAEQRGKQSQQVGGVDEIVFATTPAVQENDEEPLYVNAKQYHRILKRRMARARLMEIQKLSVQRKVRSYPGECEILPRTLLNLTLASYTALFASIKTQSCCQKAQGSRWTVPDGRGDCCSKSPGTN
jgi:hypothetical protein